MSETISNSDQRGEQSASTFDAIWASFTTAMVKSGVKLTPSSHLL